MRLHEIFVPRNSFEHNFINWFQKSWMAPEYEDAMLKFAGIKNYQYRLSENCFRGIPLKERSWETIIELLYGGRTTIPSDRRVTSWTKDQSIARYFSASGTGDSTGITIRKTLPPEDIILDTTNAMAVTDAARILDIPVEELNSIILTNEKEVIAHRRPMENIRLCEDVVGFYADFTKLNDYHLKEEFLDSLSERLVPGMFGKFEPYYHTYFRCDDNGNVEWFD